jgi:hypothetical protein
MPKHSIHARMQQNPHLIFLYYISCHLTFNFSDPKSVLIDKFHPLRIFLTSVFRFVGLKESKTGGFTVSHFRMHCSGRPGC